MQTADSLQRTGVRTCQKVLWTLLIHLLLGSVSPVSASTKLFTKQLNNSLIQGPNQPSIQKRLELEVYHSPASSVDIKTACS